MVLVRFLQSAITGSGEWQQPPHWGRLCVDPLSLVSTTSLTWRAVRFASRTRQAAPTPNGKRTVEDHTNWVLMRPSGAGRNAYTPPNFAHQPYRRGNGPFVRVVFCFHGHSKQARGRWGQPYGTSRHKHITMDP